MMSMLFCLRVKPLIPRKIIKVYDIKAIHNINTKLYIILY